VTAGAGTDAEPEKKERLLLTAGLLSIFAGGYFGVAAFIDGAPTVSLRLPLDGRLPFTDAALWIYATVYTSWSIPFFLVDSRRFFRRIAGAYLFVLLTCFAGFVLLPASTSTLREAAAQSAGGGFVSWGLRLLYALDPPTNCLPSLHVGLATIVAVLVARIDCKAAWLAAIWWGAVCLSTLATGQHYVLDVVTGAVVGGVAAAGAFAGQGRAPAGRGWPALFRYARFHALCIGALYAAYALGE